MTSENTTTWTTRGIWREQVGSFFATDKGETLRRRDRYEVISRNRLLRIADALASFANASSGGACTASYSAIASRAGEPNAATGRLAVRRAVKTLTAAGFVSVITEGRTRSVLPTHPDHN